VAFSTPHDSTGTVLTISGISGASTTNFYISNIVLSNTNPSAGGADALIDVAHLGQTTGQLAARLTRPLVVPADDGGSGRQVTFDYIGKTVILDGSTGTYAITVAGGLLAGGNTAAYYTVASSTLTLATNDAIRGQATLTVARQ
jgi:hypothetical protein